MTPKRHGYVPAAPSASLEVSLARDGGPHADVASDCLTLAHTHSNVALTQWNASLKAMNTANATLNSAVAAVAQRPADRAAETALADEPGGRTGWVGFAATSEAVSSMP